MTRLNLRISLLMALTVAIVMVLMWAGQTVSAAPALQLTPFLTPTPGADGRIIYIVQPGDTLWRISAVSGVPMDDLRGLNNLGTGDGLREGQILLLGLGGPSQPDSPQIALPTPTPPAEPTPDTGPGTGEICVLLFNDANGDTLRQDSEYAIVGAIVSVSNQAGTIALTTETTNLLDAFDNPLPVCFPDLEAGPYNITVAIAPEYNPTTVLNYALNLEAGDIAYMDFGAQISRAAPPTAESFILPAPEGGRSPLMGIVGGLLVLSGVGLAIFIGRSGIRRGFKPPRE